MNIMTFAIAVLLSTSGYAGTASNSDALLASQAQVAISEFSNQLTAEPLPPSSSGCPISGYKIIPGSEKKTGSLMNAKKHLRGLSALALSQAKDLMATNACESCQQTLQATPFLITSPSKVAYKEMCDNRPTVSFEADFQSDSEAESYTQAILNKKNQEGQRLYAGCPDPCAFTVYAGKRTLDNGKVRSTMTVQCGQPRNTSILFAKYHFSYGTALRWTCN